MQAGLGFVEFHTVVHHVAAEGIGVAVARKRANSFGHLIEVAGAVQLTTLPEDEPIVHVEAVEFQLLVGVHADGFENVFNDLRVVEKRGAEVKFEPVLIEHFVAPADAAGAFEHRDVNTRFCKQEGGS